LNLRYDQAGGQRFWDSVSALAGNPQFRRAVIRTMRFEQDAIFSLPGDLRGCGAERARTLHLVMDPTPVRRGEAQLKPLVV
jgi:hypothetical protein